MALPEISCTLPLELHLRYRVLCPKSVRQRTLRDEALDRHRLRWPDDADSKVGHTRLSLISGTLRDPPRSPAAHGLAKLQLQLAWVSVSSASRMWPGRVSLVGRGRSRRVRHRSLTPASLVDRTVPYTVPMKAVQLQCCTLAIPSRTFGLSPS
jgi:hypothetical protein